MTSRSEPEQFQASSGGQGNRLFPSAQTPEQNAQALSLTEQAPESATNSELLNQAKLVLALGALDVLLDLLGSGPFEFDVFLFGLLIFTLPLWYLYRSVQKGRSKPVLVIAIAYFLLFIVAVKAGIDKDDNLADVLSVLLLLPMTILILRIFGKMEKGKIFI
jgi:hypothetical protein